jgi:hypothetical protein
MAKAKAKTSRKTATKKKTVKKKATKKASAKSQKTFATEGPLPPKEREKVLRKLRQLSIRPSHPSSITGPALALDYNAPLPKKSKAKKTAPKRAKKKR